MAVTLSDVARHSGVSTATVSRVLNDKMISPLPENTIARIRRVAEELNYRPNPLARGLATGKTHTLGLFSRELTDPHFAQMLEAVEAKASALGYRVIVSSSLEGVTGNGRVDGTIILGNPENIGPTLTTNPQSVIYVINAEAAQPNLVAWSDEEGMFLATAHLLDLGHRAIAALFCYGHEQEALHLKVRGFRRAMAGSNAFAQEYWEAFHSEPSTQGEQYENGYRAVQRLLQTGTAFTALVARNDFLAQGALRALREAGRQVPHDISLVGYTDSIQAVCADPPLTSVRTPIAAAGEIAVEELIRRINQPGYDFPGALLPTSLSVRQSTAPP